MELIDLQSRRGEEEIHRLSSEVRFGKPAHSQPTTPPEYSDNGFPTAFSRPNRFSMSSIQQPTKITPRGSRYRALAATRMRNMTTSTTMTLHLLAPLHEGKQT
jgi:hypothetical protein